MTTIYPKRLPLAAAALSCLLALPACAKQPVVLTLTPAPVASMRDGNMVAVKGQVAEIYGNKFIVQDQSGRALVDTGPKGDDTALVKKSEAVTVQGRFERGFIHAELITRADGTNELVGPPGPGPHGPRLDGPRPPHGPGECAPPPPAADATPPSAAGK